MAAALAMLAAIYSAALAAPLWLWSVNFLPWQYAFGVDALVLCLFAAQYLALDRAALRATGARLVTEGEEPWLHAAVERLAALADVPKPRVAVVDGMVPNAFATGCDPARSTIAITRGLVSTLEPPEVEAVLAHELAHVANRDGAVMTVASFPALTLGEGIRGAPWKMWVFGLPLMGLACLGYALSLGLMLTVSRCREYTADRGAAVLTGAPEQLMSALQKIASGMSQIPQQDMRGVGAMSAFFILPTKVSSLTHPPLDKRLSRLAVLAHELGRPDAPFTAAVTTRRARRVDLLAALVTFLAVFAFVVLVGRMLR
jgi:heat shock protein HtpX